MKTAIVTDSTSSLTAAEIADNNITVVPIPVIIDDQIYLENIDLTANQLYEMQRNGAGFPKTSQPSIGEMIEIFDRLKAEGYDAIIMIPLASTISGFYQSLVTLSQTNPEYNLFVIDSQITVRLMGYLVLAAAKMAQAGLAPEEIVKNIEEIQKTTDEIFVVEDLNNLVRGGRLSNAGALVGSMLQIKPLLTFDNESHKIVSFDKVRSMKKAIAKSEKLMFARLAELDLDSLRVIIYHANSLANAEKIKADILEKYPRLPIEIDEFSPVIGTHLGEGALGLTWMQDITKLSW